MAVGDISFYKYLEAAFRYRLFNPKGITATLNTHFNYLGYNLPFNRIFFYARRVLPKFYTNEFPDTEEGNLQMARKVLEKLDRHQDQQLDSYFDPATSPEENIPVIAEAAKESVAQQAAAAPVQAPAGAPGSAMPGGIRFPSAPSILRTTPPITIKAEQPAETPATTPSQPQPTTPLPTTKKFNLSSFTSSLSSGFKKVQNFASPAGPFFKLNSSRIIRSLGGLAKAGTAGAYNFGTKIGNGGLNALERISRPGGSGGILGGIGRGGRESLIGKAKGRGGLVFAISLIGFMVLVGALTAFSPNPTPGEASPIAAGGGVSSCKFTRGQENPKEASFTSNILRSYIQEASQKSSIPPAVLAAFIRVESPSTSNMSNDEIANYSATCAESPTHALGIMQIQPPGTTSLKGDPASCDDCIDAGAKLVGKTVSTMTRQDYCDPKTNIIVGAGWILKKMSKLGYGDGTKWDPAWTNDRKAIEALVNTYYGCLLYGGTAECTGPFNYADDVSTSIQNCQIAATGITSLCPATGKISTPYGFNIPDYPQEVGNEGCGNLPGCHNGVDIAANEGLPVKSTISGTVLISGLERYKGNYVEINNPTSGLTVTFEHLATIKVTQNSSVSPGQEIGTIGKTGEGVTGPVLHYKIKRNGLLVNPFLTLDTSTTIDANTLNSSDDIAQNDYSGRKPASPDGYWGDCR